MPELALKERKPSYEDAHPYWMPIEKENEIDLVEIWRILFKRKITIVAITFLFTLLSIIATKFMPNIYKSEVLLAPAIPSKEGAMSNLMGQFGGLATIAGFDFGGNALDKTTLAIETLKSRAFIVKFIRNHDLVKPLMAADGWDFKQKKWTIDPRLYDESLGKWVRKVSYPYKKEPSDLQIYETFIKKVLTVSQDKKSKMVTVSVSTMSPEESARWAALLIKDINSHMRNNDVKEAKNSLAYLKKQLNNTSLSELHQVFYQLIEQQTKIIMLAEGREEYVFKTIDPPVVPEKKTSPRRRLICGASTMIGLLAAVIFVLLSASYKGRKSSS